MALTGVALADMDLDRVVDHLLHGVPHRLRRANYDGATGPEASRRARLVRVAHNELDLLVWWWRHRRQRARARKVRTNPAQHRELIRLLFALNSALRSEYECGYNNPQGLVRERALRFYGGVTDTY